MDSWLNYHHLHYFKVIAQEGSISKASEKLRLGQPTLSAQLKVFEDRLGIKLFERKHKKLILTESGKIALEYAEGIFKSGAELLEVLRDRKTPSRTHIQLGALDSVPKHLISRLVKFAYSVEKCSVTLLEGDGNTLIRELLSHRVDLVLANYVPSISGGDEIRARKIGEFPIGVYAHPKFKNLKKNFPKSLHGIPIVLPTLHSRLRTQIDHFLETHRIEMDRVAETQDTALQKILGIDGIGVLPLSSIAAESYVEKKDLIELGMLTGLSEEIYLISGKRKIENPISKAVMQKFTLET